MGSIPRYIQYDGALVSTESKLGKDLLQWERPFDYRPEKNPYPKMLYRAQHRPDGRRSVHEVRDALFAERGEQGQLMIVPGAAEQWSRQCQLTVKDEDEKIRAYQQGWRDTPAEALELLESRDAAVERATAERHASDARMSEKAQREADAADHTTLRQLPEIPETPVRRRGRPRKTAPTE